MFLSLHAIRNYKLPSLSNPSKRPFNLSACVPLANIRATCSTVMDLRFTFILISFIVVDFSTRQSDDIYIRWADLRLASICCRRTSAQTWRLSFTHRKKNYSVLCCVLEKKEWTKKHLLPPSFHFVYFPSSWQTTPQTNEICQALLSPKSALRFSVSLDSLHLILSRSKRWNFTNCCQTRDSFFLTNAFTSRDRTKLS